MRLNAGEQEAEPLLQFLFGLYTDGVLSTRHLQKGAKAALSTVNARSDSHSTLVELARLGNQGVHEGNAYRDFMRRIVSKGNMPDLYETMIPTWDAESCSQQTCSNNVYFMLPHELLPKLCGVNVQAWAKFSDSTATLASRLAQWCARTGAPKRTDGCNDLVSLGIWGDSAPYNTRDSLYVILWNALSGENRTRFWLTCLPKKLVCKCGCHGRHSFEALWKVVGWSLRCLLLGQYPSTRHDGSCFNNAFGDRRRALLSGKLGLRGACLQMRRDWSWLKEAFDLQGWAQGSASQRVCFKCPADCGRFNWRDSSLQAAWRSVPRITHQSFMTDRLLREAFVSEIWNFPGFQLEYVSLDWMHIADLGVTQIVLGSLMLECFVQVGGLTFKPGPACGILLTLIKRFSKHLGVQPPINALTINMFRPNASKPVRFKGKAAECRHLLPVMVEIIKVAMPLESDHEILRYNCCAAFAKIYWEITHWTDGAADRAIEQGRKFNVLFRELSESRGPLVWRQTPKIHLFNHLLEEMKVAGNASDHWCYPDERMIGKAAKIAATTHASTVSKNCMQKYKCCQLF